MLSYFLNQVQHFSLNDVKMITRHLNLGRHVEGQVFGQLYPPDSDVFNGLVMLNLQPLHSDCNLKILSFSLSFLSYWACLEKSENHYLGPVVSSPFSLNGGQVENTINSMYLWNTQTKIF